METFIIVCTCHYGKLTFELEGDSEEEVLHGVEELLCQLDSGDFDKEIFNIKDM